MTTDPIRLLEDEHRFIAKVFSAASGLADRLDDLNRTITEQLSSN